MSYRTVSLALMLVISGGFCSRPGWLISPSLMADEAKDPGKVEFLVGNYLVSEGGTWKADESPLRGPFGIDFDSAGAMYIIELSSGSLHKLSAKGELKRLRGPHEKNYSGDGGVVSEAGFNGPHNCVVTAADSLLISDSWNHCVRQVDLETLRVGTIAGTGASGFSGDKGPARSARFNYIMCIELSVDGKTLHLADLKNRRIRNMDLETGRVRTVAGNGKKGVPEDGAPAAKSPLVDPRAVSSDAGGRLYILERGGHALRVLGPKGEIHTVAGTGRRGFRDGEALKASFGSPKHICCDPTGNVYIADDANKAIRRFNPKTRRVSTVLGRGFGDSKIKLLRPHGVRWYQGHLYVVDTGHNRILRIKPR